MLRWIGWSAGALVAIVVAGAAYLAATRGPFVRHALPVGAGVAAELACAGVYVSERPLDEVVRRDVARLSPLTGLNAYRQGDRAVTVSVLGLETRTAVYRPGLGCTLLVNATAEGLREQARGIPVPSTAPRPEPWPKGDGVDLGDPPPGVDTAALHMAVVRAFTDETAKREIDTRALVVVKDGRIVEERYAPGFDQRSRFLGWSMSKSVTATLVGALVADGKLDLYAPPGIAEWKWPGDPRGQITLLELLNMSSGLEFAEPYDPGSDSTAMLFESADMGAYAASRPLAHPPETVWAYSSGTANILSRLVKEKTGGTLAAYSAYARSRLFAPAGMTSAVFEPDESGTFVGSSLLYMSARDWARFGLIYLNYGEINGARIVPESFVAFVRRPAPADPSKGYGGQFWLNGVDGRTGARQFAHLPKDMYCAEGHNDEFVCVFPSQGAVIVRLGWTTGDAAFDLDRHFGEILAALGK